MDIKKIKDKLDKVGETRWKLQNEGEDVFDIKDLIKECFIYAEGIDTVVNDNVTELITIKNIQAEIAKAQLLVDDQLKEIGKAIKAIQKDITKIQGDIIGLQVDHGALVADVITNAADIKELQKVK